MKYFIDTEFHEYKKKVLPWLKGIDTIDLISIGIVSEDNREYYAISKDFDLKDAWNSYQMKQVDGDLRNRYPDGIKEYWLRDNVLIPIGKELKQIYHNEQTLKSFEWIGISYKILKSLLKRYGKTKAEIATEVKRFIEAPTICKVKYKHEESITGNPVIPISDFNIEFYAYYADYDWVVFCWLFGRMIDLPKGFPKYALDIQQLIYEYNIDKNKLKKDIPQEGCHNALQDALWNKKAFKYIQNIINEKRTD